MSLFNMGDKAYVMLANGRIFEGYSFGAKGTSVGEIVFATGMTGYEETLSDPSYFGQIVTQTFPLIGMRQRIYRKRVVQFTLQFQMRG